MNTVPLEKIENDLNSNKLLILPVDFKQTYADEPAEKENWLFLLTSLFHLYSVRHVE